MSHSNLGLQGPDERPISRRKVECSQLLGRHPFQIVATEYLPGAGLNCTSKKMQFDGLFRIVMANRLKRERLANLDSQLLAHLSPQAVLERFPLFALASRKLPQAGEVGARLPPGDQIEVPRSDDGSCDLNGCPRGHARRSKG